MLPRPIARFVPSENEGVLRPAKPDWDQVLESHSESEGLSSEGLSSEGLSPSNGLARFEVSSEPEIPDESEAHSEPGIHLEGQSEFGPETGSESAIQFESEIAGESEVRAEPNDKLLHSFDFSENKKQPRPAHHHQPYEGWAIVLGMLVILAAVAISFLVGARVGWLGPHARVAPPASTSLTEAPAAAERAEGAAAVSNTEAAPAKRQKRDKPSTAPTASTDSQTAATKAALESGELVVYEKGKVVYESTPSASAPAVETRAANSAPDGGSASTANALAPQASASHAPTASSASPVGSAVVPAASNARITSSRVWLAPDEAEDRLVTRVEPQYPAEALAAHRSGSVVLEVNVAEDGKVSSVKTLIGDPVLASAATAAVRNWRYQPYRSKERPMPFQTDVTLTFSLPN